MENQNPYPVTNIPKPSPLPLILLSLLLVFSLSSSAFLFYQNQQLQTQITIMSKPQITEVLTPSISPDPTIEWETYTIQDPGISLKYPSNWSHKYIQSGNLYQSSLQLTDPSNGNQTEIPTIVVNVYKNPQGLSPQDFDRYFIDTFDQFQHMPFYMETAIPKMIGELNGIYFPYDSCEPGSCDVYVIVHNQTVVRVLIIHDIVDTNTTDQILSTFKFTN
jgi:hypothetical protein